MSMSVSAPLKAFIDNLVNLINEVQGSVLTLADECRQAMLIPGDLYDVLIQGQGTPKDKARKLLNFISSRIESQDELVEPEKCVFKQFVAILRKEPSFEEIADRLETARSEVEDRANNFNVPCTEEPSDDEKSEPINIQVVSPTTKVSKGVAAFTSTVSAKSPFYGVETVRPQSAMSQKSPSQQVMGGGSLKQKRVSTSTLIQNVIDQLHDAHFQAIAEESTISQFEEQCQGLRQELHSARAEKNKVSVRLKAKEKELRELMNQKCMLESNLTSRVTDTEHELEVEPSEKEQCKEECKELQEKIDRCKQENKVLNAELKKCKEKEASLLQEVSSLNEEVQTPTIKLEKKKVEYKGRMAYGKLLSDREAYVAVCSGVALVLTVICLVSILVILIVLVSLYSYFAGRGWLSPSVLEITVIDPALGEGVVRPSVEPLNFNLTFTPNYCHIGTEVMPSNAILPTETPWCVGINVCEDETTTGNPSLTTGICSANQSSQSSLEPLNFNLTFTPNYFQTGTEVMPSNAILPTETPWCVGIDECRDETTTGNPSLTTGICSANQSSQSFFYFEADDDLTPSISRVVASDPDNAGDVYGANDVITIFFSASTDQPRVATKADLDKIVLFNPSLGADYGGRWLSPSVLEITIIDPALGEGVVRPSVEPLNFNLTFTPNYFHTGTEVMPSNAILPTETPWCVGINVCGEETTTGDPPFTIGICSANQLSCRANQGWSNLEGSFGTGMGVPIFPWYWILVAVVVVIVIIVIIVLVVVCYRYYKRKAERKEALRVVRRWKKEQFTPGGKEEGKKEGPKPWVKPPDVATMRENPDPFNVLQKLPEVVPRPPTALTEVEHLPPVPQQPFKPRGGASIRPSLGPMGVGTPLPRISRTVSGSSLPPALGLPPLTKAPDAPARAERRTTLPPLKGGGALASQARRALGDTRPPPGTGGTALPDELLPRTVPHIKLPQSPPRPSLGTTPLPRPGATPLSPIGKGKQSSTGKPILKKSPPTSSEEDISSSDAAAGSGSALPTLSPPFKTTRPLQPISRPSLGGGAALPPIRTPGGPPRPGLTSPITMPSRRTSVAPFAADSAPPTSPSRKTTVTLGPLEPTRPLGRALPTPLAPRAPPISPTNVTVSTSTTVTTTVKEETKKEPDDSKKS